MRAAFGCNSCKEWHDGGRRKRQLLHMLVSLSLCLLLSIKHRSNGCLKVTCRPGFVPRELHPNYRRIME